MKGVFTGILVLDKVEVESATKADRRKLTWSQIIRINKHDFALYSLYGWQTCQISGAESQEEVGNQDYAQRHRGNGDGGPCVIVQDVAQTQIMQYHVRPSPGEHESSRVEEPG